MTFATVKVLPEPVPPQKDVVLLPLLVSLQEPRNRRRLVPGCRVRRSKLKVHEEVGSCNVVLEPTTYNLLIEREQLHH